MRAASGAAPATPDTAVSDGGTCLNCGAARHGPYCHACGQERVDVAAPVSALAREGVRDALSWDNRTLRTLRVLLTAPGALAEAWAAGRRAPFVPPVRLYFLLGAALLALSALDGWVADESDAGWDRAERGEVERERAAANRAAYTAGQLIGTLGLNALLLLVPVVGFGYYVLFKERRPVLAGHLVLALHVASAALAVLVAWKAIVVTRLLVAPEAEPFLNAEWGVDLAIGALLLGVVAYAALAVRRFYGVGWGGAVGAGLLVGLLPPVLLIGLVVVVALVQTLG